MSPVLTLTYSDKGLSVQKKSNERVKAGVTLRYSAALASSQRNPTPLSPSLNLT